MKAHVDERADGRSRAAGSCHVMQAECSPAPLENGVYVRVVPARIAKLDRVITARRQPSDEGLEAIDVSMPAWRQLVEHRSKTVSQPIRAVPEPAQRLLGVQQSLVVGKVAAGLDRHDEARRQALAPFVELVRIRQTVEAVVELDRVERLGVEL